MSDGACDEPLSSVLRAWQQAEVRGVTKAPGGELTVGDVYDDLVGTWEIAEELGVPKRRVERWIERRASTGCPSPVRVLKMGFLYSMSDWRGWYALWKVTRAADTWQVNRPRGAAGLGG